MNLKEAEYSQPLANKQANFAWHNQCLRLSEKYEMCYFLFQSCQTENFGSHADIYDWVLKNPSGVAKNFPPWPGIWVKRTEKSCARAQQIQLVLVDKYERHPPSRNRSKLSIQKYETDIICLKQKCMSCTTNTILSFDKYERHPLKGQVKTVHPKI